MVFNWFRRPHSDSPSAKPEDNTSGEENSATPEAEEQLTSTESQAAPAQTSPEELSEDVTAQRLLWAKAAFKKIQQQSSPQVQEVAAETSSATGAIETEQTPETTADVRLVVEPTLNQVAADEAASTSSESEPTETALLPFWKRAQADRQARIEKLKQTAIETPEVVATELAAATTPDATLATPEKPAAGSELAFDEGFLWSAEILAAQGRRPEDVSIEEITWLKKLRQGLDKTRRNLVNQLKTIVGQGPLNQAAVMEIEALLLQADVGVEATDKIVNTLQKKLRQEVLPPDAAIAYLKEILQDMLDEPLQKSHNPTFAPEKDTLNIWLITGVNGAGKTTTIGKIAHIAQKSGYKCLIGAADTFRAAAVEQVKIWGQRSGVEVIANPGQNTDPAAVVFDAIAAAQSRGIELLLVDTAGRLQNKKNLMEELSKIRRIVDKKASSAKVESLLVLDATLGQNGLRQAEVFAQAAQLSGVVLTKLDGTAKGGVALAVVQQLGLPIRFIGAGEGIEDLRPFSSYEFVEALLSS